MISFTELEAPTFTLSKYVHTVTNATVILQENSTFELSLLSATPKLYVFMGMTNIGVHVSKTQAKMLNVFKE